MYQFNLLFTEIDTLLLIQFNIKYYSDYVCSYLSFFDSLSINSSIVI